MRRTSYTLCVLCVLVAGCGGGGAAAPRDPRALVLDYWHALARGDGGRACSDLTAERRISVVAEDQRVGAAPAGASCEAVLSKQRTLGQLATQTTIENVAISGDQATITISISPTTPIKPTMSAVEEGGSWKLAGPPPQ
jgi:hypothetical protein